MSYPHPIVVVYWDDAVSHSDGSGRARHTPAHQVAIGWLLQHDDDGISIAYEYSDDDGSWRDEQFIPGAMITRIEVIEIEGT